MPVIKIRRRSILGRMVYMLPSVAMLNELEQSTDKK